MNEKNFIVVFNWKVAQKLIEKRYQVHHLDKNYKRFGVVFYFKYSSEAQSIVDEWYSLEEKMNNI